MFFSDRITLRIRTYPTNDSNGSPVSSDIDTACWADRVSTTRSEFYSAKANGIDAIQSYEVNAEDWNNQNMVVDGTKEYYIVRAYQKGLGKVVLTCSDKAV